MELEDRFAEEDPHRRSVRSRPFRALPPPVGDSAAGSGRRLAHRGSPLSPSRRRWASIRPVWVRDWPTVGSGRGERRIVQLDGAARR